MHVPSSGLMYSRFIYIYTFEKKRVFYDDDVVLPVGPELAWWGGKCTIYLSNSEYRLPDTTSISGHFNKNRHLFLSSLNFHASAPAALNSSQKTVWISDFKCFHFLPIFLSLSYLSMTQSVFLSTSQQNCINIIMIIIPWHAHTPRTTFHVPMDERNRLICDRQRTQLCHEHTFACQSCSIPMPFASPSSMRAVSVFSFLTGLFLCHRMLPLGYSKLAL